MDLSPNWLDGNSQGSVGTAAAVRSSADLPGPPGDRWTGCLEAYERDRLAFLIRARADYGALVRFDDRTTIVNDLDHAHEILGDHAAYAVLGNFRNQRISLDQATATQQLRRHLNPPLRSTALGDLGAITRREVGAAFDGPQAPPRSLDPLPRLEQAFARSIATLYFGADGTEVAERVHRLLDALSAVFGNPLALPYGVPTPANLRVRRRYRTVRAVVDRCVHRRLETDAPAGELAACVARAAAADGHSVDRIADLLIGSLLAGIRVPAAGAAWTLMHLGRQPTLLPRAADERSILPIVLESLRLHPPTWLIRRVCVRTVELGGYRFEAGHNFLISPYVIHRDDAVFANPEHFDPRRWADTPVSAMLAFGRGIHRCPGQDAGIMMITEAVKHLHEAYDVHVPAGQRVTPDPRTSLIPAGLLVGLTTRRGEDSGRRG